MASGRLLQCQELLAEIFSHLEVPTSLNEADDALAVEINCKRQERRSALASAALSIRAFTEHAQAALWRRLDSVQPLLSLLSDDHLDPSDLPLTVR